MNRRYEHLLSPIRIRDFVLKNRMINSKSISQELQGPQIYPDEPYQRYTTDYAKNGAALVALTVGSWPNEQGGHGPMDQFYMEDRKVLNAYAKQIDRVHAFSSLASGNVMLDFGRTQISQVHDPSLITWRGDYGGGPRFVYGKLPEVTKDQIERAFDQACAHASDLGTMGFDCINIHMSYRSGILANALSPALNQRTDEFGGSLENRVKIPLELFRRLRETVGNHKLIMCQMSPIEEPLRLHGGGLPVLLRESGGICGHLPAPGLGRLHQPYQHLQFLRARSLLPEVRRRLQGAEYSRPGGPGGRIPGPG